MGGSNVGLIFGTIDDLGLAAGPPRMIFSFGMTQGGLLLFDAVLNCCDGSASSA